MNESTHEPESAARPLETEFTRGKVKYSQICRDNNLAIYRRNSSQYGWEDFEVVKIRTRKAGERTLPNGEVLKYEAAETYPSDEEWGDRAWTFQAHEEAELKFQSVRDAINSLVQSTVEGVLSPKTGQQSGDESGGRES